MNPCIDDPYAVLNLKTTANTDEIQQAYKSLSRAIHPDKQNTNKKHNAQKSFLDLKGSYDILIDPAFRFAYDKFGAEGLRILKDSAELYAEVCLLLETHHTNSVTDSSYLRDALIKISETKQANWFQSRGNLRPSIETSLELNCDATHSTFPFNIDDVVNVEETNLNISINGVPFREEKLLFNLEGFGGLCRPGEGRAGGKVALKYEVMQGTDLNFNLGFSENGKVSSLHYFAEPLNMYLPFIGRSSKLQWKHLA